VPPRQVRRGHSRLGDSRDNSIPTTPLGGFDRRRQESSATGYPGPVATGDAVPAIGHRALVGPAAPPTRGSPALRRGEPQTTVKAAVRPVRRSHTAGQPPGPNHGILQSSTPATRLTPPTPLGGGDRHCRDNLTTARPRGAPPSRREPGSVPRSSRPSRGQSCLPPTRSESGPARHARNSGVVAPRRWL
jgi:hypothetical protein